MIRSLWWIINTIIIVPSHQRRSADASALPPLELTCSFTWFFSLVNCSRSTYFIPISSLFYFFPHSIPTTDSLLSSVSKHPSRFSSISLDHWMVCLRGIQKLQCTTKSCISVCVYVCTFRGLQRKIIRMGDCVNVKCLLLCTSSIYTSMGGSREAWSFLRNSLSFLFL